MLVARAEVASNSREREIMEWAISWRMRRLKWRTLGRETCTRSKGWEAMMEKSL